MKNWRVRGPHECEKDKRITDLEAEVSRLRGIIRDHGCNLTMLYEMEEGLNAL